MDWHWPIDIESAMRSFDDILVTYSGGVLRPDSRLDVPEGTRFRVSMRDEHPTAESRKHARELIDRVRREGLIKLQGMRWKRSDLYDRG